MEDAPAEEALPEPVCPHCLGIEPGVPDLRPVDLEEVLFSPKLCAACDARTICAECHALYEDCSRICPSFRVEVREVARVRGPYEVGLRWFAEHDGRRYGDGAVPRSPADVRDFLFAADEVLRRVLGLPDPAAALLAQVLAGEL